MVTEHGVFQSSLFLAPTGNDHGALQVGFQLARAYNLGASVGRFFFPALPGEHCCMSSDDSSTLWYRIVQSFSNEGSI